IKSGTHVVQMDTTTLPLKYTAVAYEKNTRTAGRAFSRFVDLQGGTLWRVDFYAGRKPLPKGKLSLQLFNVTPKDPEHISYGLKINNKTVPISNANLMIMLPEGVTLQPGSSRIGTEAPSEPENEGNIVTYRNLKIEADCDKELTFNVIRTDNKTEPLQTKAVLMFDTPTKRKLRSAVLEHKLGNNIGKEWSLDTVGKIAGLESADENKPAKPKKKNLFTREWISTATPDIQWMTPENNALPRFPSVTITIKHNKAHKVKTLLNGQPVPAVNYDGKIYNRQGAAISRWTGVNIREGDNKLEAIISTKDGKEIKHLSRAVHYSRPPIYAEVVPERSILEADGVHSPIIAVRLTDKDNYPAREDTIGQFLINAPYRHASTDKFNKTLLPGSYKGKLPTYTVGKDGIALIKLAPTSNSGQVNITLHLINGQQNITARLFNPTRDWIVVGFAEGTAGYNKLNGKIEDFQGKESKNFTTDAKTSFFAKGRVLGKWLLTMAYDSEKKNLDEDNSLHQKIDPGTYYTVYGDASANGYEAASREKVYLKLERQTFYALFGDFKTNLSDSSLTRYSRALTGLKSEYHNNDTDVILFASESNQAFVRDELQGKDITGPYNLTRQNIVLNSEQITIETRDRFRSEEIISTKQLASHIDYDIDYQEGTINFREPILRSDRDLNLNFIVINYESNDNNDRSVIYGGRAKKTFDKKLSLGITHVKEGRVGSNYELSGTDITYKPSDNTVIRAEKAFSQIRNLVSGKKDNAYLVEIQQQLGKWGHKIYIKETASSYGLGQTSTVENGTRKFGADITFKPTATSNIMARAYQQDTLGSNSRRNVYEADGEMTVGKTKMHLGGRSATDSRENTDNNTTNTVIAGATRSMLDGKIAIKVDREQGIGKTTNIDFPTSTKLGATYQVSPKAKMFV
ncbi:MAG: hypothetical protein OEL55_05030, partial [Desulfobulbaceae bacterium]|nr:hypothetical protein [Desulfobulbaceae bacterium]